MKKIRSLILTLFVALLIPVLNVSAASKLTIDSKSYDPNTKEFKVSGNSDYADVMVSIFDEKEEVLAFKTVTASGGKYTATFNMTFDEDMEVTIKVGDINSTDYKLSTLEVEKTKVPVRSNKITEEGSGHSLTILDSLKKFEIDDTLHVELHNDFENLNEEEQALLNFMKRQLGDNKELYGVLDIVVKMPNGDDKDLPDTENGYEFFLHIDEDTLKAFNKPRMARILDEEFTLEDARALVYDEETEGVTVKLNNVGQYVLYDDLTKDYDFLDKTGDQSYNVKKDGDLVLKVDADVKKFVSLAIDGKLVDEKNYTVKSGSTVITLKKEYVQSLSEGEHAIKVNFTDGEANTTLTISSTNPKTGDNIIKYIVVLIVGLVGFGGMGLYLKKRIKN